MNVLKKVSQISLIFMVMSLLLISSHDYYQVEHTPKIKRIRSTASHKSSPEMKAARWDYFHRLLRDPEINKIPVGIRQKELAHASTLPRVTQNLKKPNTAWFVWEEAGPVDVGGRTRALAVDVTNSNTIIAGGVSGGIWKSTDNGVTWNLKNDPSQNLSVTSLAQDTRPGNTNTWYYATGEYRGNSARDRGARADFQGSGLFRSTDNGDTWQLIASTANPDPTGWDSEFDYVSRIIVSPITGTVFIASHGVGVLRSIDGGNNFSLVLGDINDQYYSDVIVSSSGTLLAALSESGYNPIESRTYSPGIYKSGDDGINWDNITPASFPASHRRTVLAYAPSNPDVAYALTNTGEKDLNGNDDVRLHKLTVSSGTSQDRSANIPDYEGLVGNFNTQGNYNMLIAVKPDDENFVILGATNLYRSTNGFNSSEPQYYTWFGGYHPDNNFSQYPNQHPDQHVIAFDPSDPNKMWCGHDGGISYALDITANSSSSSDFPWVDKNDGYNVTQFYTVAIADEAGNQRIMGGTQDNGTPVFTWDGDATSLSQDVSSGDGAYAYFGDTYAYTSSQNGRVLRLGYDQAGIPNYDSEWSNITPDNVSGQLFINPFMVDPNDEDIMYYVAGNHLLRNSQLGDIPFYLNGTSQGWNDLIALAVDDGYVISALAISQNPAHILYYGASAGGGGTALSPKIYRVENANTATSRREDRSIIDAAAGSYLHTISINPDDADEILVGFSNYGIIGLYHSQNGGQSYEAVEGNLEGPQGKGPSIRSATILPTTNGTIYLVGSSTGVYSTKDLNGSSTVWSQEGSDLIGNVVVEYITSRPSDGHVAVGTHGRGIFKGSRDPAPINRADQGNQPSIYELAQNYPNPFNPTTTIEYNLPVTEHVILKVYNAAGQQITTLVDSYKKAGRHRIVFDGKNLSTGLYFYSITAGSFTDSKKLLLIK
jgi:hypothetical protein